MKLMKQTLRNFKGVPNFTLDVGGNNATVFGDNATGKTTLYDAFLWLLFEKDSAGRKDFDIKTLDARGEALNGLEHEVEAVMDVNGRPLTLRKVYYEKWTKQRGSVERVFTGHTTDHFVDGVPVPKKDFTERIGRLVEEEIFKLLTSPTYFNSLHWEKRRKILLQVCGDITDDDVIASNEKLAGLPAILDGRKLDDHKTVIKSRRTEINREIEKLPVRINEVQRSLPILSSLGKDQLSSEIAALRERRKAKEKEIARMETGGEVAEKTKELRLLEGEIEKLKNDHQGLINEKVNEKRQELSTVKSRIRELKDDIDILNRRKENNTNEAGRLESKLKSLREEWIEVDGNEFTLEQSDTCPTCNQALPQEQLAEARQKAEEQFNRDKADRLEKINTDGQFYKGQMESLKTDATEIAEKINETKKQLLPYQEKIMPLEQEIEKLQGQGLLTTEDSAYGKMVKEKEALQSLIDELNMGSREALDVIQDEIDFIDTEISKLQGYLDAFDQHTRGQERIKELKAQEKDLAREYEKLEGELNMVDEFTRTKVAMLDSRINSKFKLARFKMFEVQVNGGLAECCETLYNGVPYSSNLNNGARINVGLDIINTLSDHYGFTAPIFVDNAEAVTELIDTRGQLIKLVVHPEAKKLRVEVDNGTLFKEAV